MKAAQRGQHGAPSLGDEADESAEQADQVHAAEPGQDQRARADRQEFVRPQVRR